MGISHCLLNLLSHHDNSHFYTATMADSHIFDVVALLYSLFKNVLILFFLTVALPLLCNQS